MKKKSWILISVLFVVSILVLTIILNARYTWNYSSAIGGVGQGTSYSELMRIHGEPQNIIIHDNRNPQVSLAQYDGIEFVLLNELVFKIRITSSEIRFGRRQIGVGSTREEILDAYDYNERWLRRTAVTIARFFHNMDGRPPQFGRLFKSQGKITVNDGGTWIEFSFDENDLVNRIDITFLSSPPGV